MLKSVLKSGQYRDLRLSKPLKGMARPAGIEPATPCLEGRLAASTVFSQLFPFVAITRFWGVCFRSQRLRLARLRGEFSDGFLTVVAATAMFYGLCSTLLQYWFSSCNSLARREDALRRARGPTFPNHCQNLESGLRMGWRGAGRVEYDKVPKFEFAKRADMTVTDLLQLRTLYPPPHALHPSPCPLPVRTPQQRRDPPFFLSPVFRSRDHDRPVRSCSPTAMTRRDMRKFPGRD